MFYVPGLLAFIFGWRRRHGNDCTVCIPAEVIFAGSFHRGLDDGEYEAPDSGGVVIY